MLWFRKLLSLLLVSVGVSLLFLPFPERLAGEKDIEVVQLEIQPAPVTEPMARKRFGSAFVQFSYDGLAPYPEVREAVLGLMGRSGSRCVPEDEWKSLLTAFSIVEATGMGYAFRDGLYRVAGVEKEDGEAGGHHLVCAEVVFLGAYDNPDWGSMPRLAADDLDRYPAIKSELQRLAGGPVPAVEGVDVSPRQWRRFHRQLLEKDEYRPSFVIYGRLVTGGVQDQLSAWSLEVPWLRKACRIMGIAALIFGIAMAFAVYRFSAVRSGIPVSPVWLAIFCDLLLLVGGVTFIALAIDTLWVGPLGQPSLLGLEPEWLSAQKITGLHFVSIPAVFIALPLLSLWFTSLSAQRILVDDEGVTSLGALGSISIGWTDLEAVRLREQRNPFSFTVLDFRSLQRVVDLEAGSRSITVNEPATRRNKQAILKAFERHIPEAKRGLIKKLETW